MDRLSRQLQTFFILLTDAAAREEGMPIDEVAALLGVRRRRVASWIARVKDVGDPLGGPEAFVDLELLGDRVKVHFAPHASEGAIRFSVAEILALLFLLSQVDRAEVPGPLIAKVARLRARLLSLATEGAREAASPEQMIVEGEGACAPRFLRLIDEAVRTRQGVAMRYYSVSKDRLQSIDLRPCALVQHRGAWYAVTGDDFRFRVDRIREARLTGEPFEPPADFDLDRYRKDSIFDGETPETITLRREGGDPYAVPTASVPQLLSWVREQAGEVEVVAPPEAREKLVASLRERLRVYR